MKTIIQTSLLALSLLLLSCEKPITIPEVETTEITYKTQVYAWAGGNVISNGGEELLKKGLCWSTDSIPTVADSKTFEGIHTGVFSSQMTDLTSNTTYHLRAYATNGEGTAYGDEIIFTTNDNTVPTPCNPDTNSIYFGSQRQTFYHVSPYDNGFSYKFKGSGSDSDLSIEFNKAPVTGKYVTSNSPGVSSNECYVSGVFGGTFSYFYVGSEYDTVYVIQNGEGIYTMSFCDLHFASTSSQTNIEFDTDGNLSNE
jgi:hypothetical protein